MFAKQYEQPQNQQAAGKQEVDRITVNMGDAHLLPSQVRRITVLAGSIWLSRRVEDIVLHTSQHIELSPGKDRVVVTSLGHKPARIEIELS